MMPSVVDSKTFIPGNIGWGVERPHLCAESKMIPVDTMNEEFPIRKKHVNSIDLNRTSVFPQTTGLRAAALDQKLGIDYDMYHAMNM